MTTPAYEISELPPADDLAGAVEQVEAALTHLEDVVLARVTRQALADAEDEQPIPAEHLWAEIGL